VKSSVIRRRLFPIVTVALLAAMSSCTATALLNLTAPTGTFVGPNGQVVPRNLRVSFINNTPFRAVFTFGSYDPLDKDTSPTNFGQLRLESGATSAVQNQPCRKVFSVGGEELIRLIQVRKLTVNDEHALVDGTNFSGAPLGDPLEAVATEGTAVGRIDRAGVDYDCESVIVYTFEQDATAPGGFRIDANVVKP